MGNWKRKFREIDLDIDFSPVKSNWRIQKAPKLGLSEKEEKVYSIPRGDEVAASRAQNLLYIF